MQAMISEVNNQGVDSLEGGDFSCALQRFRLVLEQAKRNTGPTVLTSKTPELKTIRPLSPIFVEKQVLVQQHPPKTRQSLHAGGFRLTDGLSSSSDPAEDFNIHLAITIFHLALTLHLVSLADQADQSTQRLLKAKELYLRAHQVLVGSVLARYRGKATGNAIVDLVAMAIINNLALVCIEVSEFEEGEFLFGQLVRYALSTRRVGTYSTPFMRKKVHLFLLNATVAKLIQPLSAAAA
jgi:hypothetical protein